MTKTSAVGTWSVRA